MEFTFGGFDTQRQYNHVFPSSFSNYTYLSDQPMIQMQIGAGFPSPSLMQPQPPHICHQFEEFEAVPFRRLPPSPKMKEVIRYQSRDVKKEIIVLGKPTDATLSGSKRKAAATPTVAGSSALCSNNSKKITEEWRCAVCDISVTCERGLIEHLDGKKHLAKVQSLKGNKIGGDIGLGLTKNPTNKQTSEVKRMKGDNTGGDIMNGCVQKQQKIVLEEVKMMSKGGRMRKKFKFWCKMCQIGAHDEKVMIDHKKGKKHVKNRRKKARARRRFSDRK